jgi:hypothetical protein
MKGCCRVENVAVLAFLHVKCPHAPSAGNMPITNLPLGLSTRPTSWNARVGFVTKQSVDQTVKGSVQYGRCSAVLWRTSIPRFRASLNAGFEGSIPSQIPSAQTTRTVPTPTSSERPVVLSVTIVMQANSNWKSSLPSAESNQRSYSSAKRSMGVAVYFEPGVSFIASWPS